MLELLDSWIHQAGPLAIVAIGLAALLEHVFPPFPGDTVTLFGGFYAVRSGIHLGWVFGAIMAGSLVGSAIDYYAGRWVVAISERSARARRWLHRIPVHQWEEKFRHRATMWLLVNRFLPGVRGPIFFAAGASGVPVAKALLLGGLSALVWNTALFALGLLAGANASRLAGFIGTYGIVVWCLLGALVLFWLFRFWRKRSRPPPRCH